MKKYSLQNPDMAKRAESTRRAPQRRFRHLHAKNATAEVNVKRRTLGSTSTLTTAAQANDLFKDDSYWVFLDCT